MAENITAIAVNWEAIMRFKKQKDGFSFYLNGRLVIRHTADAPWIYVGAGNAVYDMHRGNFKIKDDVQMKLPLPDYAITQAEGAVRITFSRCGLLPVTAVFTVQDGREVILFETPDKSLNRIWLRLYAEQDEHIYGCGEQFSYFDLRGKSFPLWTAEQGVGRNKSTHTTFLADNDDQAGGDYYTTFFPAPTFVSSRKYYCHIKDTAYMAFDFSHADYHELQIWNIPEQMILEAADEFTELTQKLTGLLGRQPELPEWVYSGVILGIQGGTQTCLEKLRHAQEKGVKVAGIWAQDWEGQRITSFGKRLMWNWQWNPQLYPGLDETIKELRAEGTRFLGYINPYVAVEGPLFQEASQKGLLAKDSSGGDYLVEFGEFYAGVVDFTNNDACEWYKGVIKKYLIDFGLSGWMADFGEYLPTDVVLHNGVSAEIMHNAWPALWARINAEAIEECGKTGEITFFMRAGYTGSQRYAALLWAGDQNVDWSLDDGLASVIPAALSAGMSGCGLHHSDIGGYTTLYGMRRTKELFMRWAEMAAFSVMMRSHEGNRPGDNWQFDSDDETLLHLARMSRVFTALASYIKAAVAENAQKGIPVQRPLFMHYEQDAKAYAIQYEYLFGRDALVAPVYEEGATEWQVHLPEDEWVHVWTGKKYDGGDITVVAPLGCPPVFYREKSQYADLFGSLKSI